MGALADGAGMNKAAQQGSPRAVDARGFTLVEVIVVLSVVLLLTGIAVPMLSSYMEDGRRARAEAECKVIGASLTSFYKDLGVFPARNSGGTNNVVQVLLSSATRPTINPFNGTHTWITAGMSATTGDVLNNHLGVNRPQGATGAAVIYPTTGNMRWRGPYQNGDAPLDPWGRPYVINVQSGWSNNATNFKRLWVLSAGPDGLINTNQAATATTNPAGDDIAFLVYQRP
jgi:prepilin-type N-terminal cleavage/methylation domain-containing protein